MPTKSNIDAQLENIGRLAFNFRDPKELVEVLERMESKEPYTPRTPKGTGLFVLKAADARRLKANMLGSKVAANAEDIMNVLDTVEKQIKNFRAARRRERGKDKPQTIEDVRMGKVLDSITGFRQTYERFQKSGENMTNLGQPLRDTLGEIGIFRKLAKKHTLEAHRLKEVEVDLKRELRLQERKERDQKVTKRVVDQDEKDARVLRNAMNKVAQRGGAQVVKQTVFLVSYGRMDSIWGRNRDLILDRLGQAGLDIETQYESTQYIILRGEFVMVIADELADRLIGAGKIAPARTVKGEWDEKNKSFLAASWWLKSRKMYDFTAHIYGGSHNIGGKVVYRLWLMDEEKKQALDTWLGGVRKWKLS